MLVGFRHQLSRHVSITWNNTLAIFKRDPGFIATISPSVPFDPNQTYAPTTDFFNNRTIAASSQLGLVIQRSTRLSMSFNGGIFDTNRAAVGLYGVLGETAVGDVQYRLTRRATIGANYSYSHYGFSHLISNSNLQGVCCDLCLPTEPVVGVLRIWWIRQGGNQIRPKRTGGSCRCGYYWHHAEQPDCLQHALCPQFQRAAFANLSQRRPLCERRPCGDTWKRPVSYLRCHDGQLADIPTRVYADGVLELILRTRGLSPLEM